MNLFNFKVLGSIALRLICRRKTLTTTNQLQLLSTLWIVAVVVFVVVAVVVVVFGGGGGGGGGGAVVAAAFVFAVVLWLFNVSVFQGQICSDNCTCRHTVTEVTDQTCYFTLSQYTGTGPFSPSTDPITPNAWQGVHRL